MARYCRRFCFCGAAFTSDDICPRGDACPRQELGRGHWHVALRALEQMSEEERGVRYPHLQMDSIRQHHALHGRQPRRSASEAPSRLLMCQRRSVTPRARSLSPYHGSFYAGPGGRPRSNEHRRRFPASPDARPRSNEQRRRHAVPRSQEHLQGRQRRQRGWTRGISEVSAMPHGSVSPARNRPSEVPVGRTMLPAMFCEELADVVGVRPGTTRCP